jgi:hypothetical protein
MQKPFEIRGRKATVILDRVVDEGLVKKIPALLTRASIEPNRASAVSTTALAVSGSAMSPSTQAKRSDAPTSPD